MTAWWRRALAATAALAGALAPLAGSPHRRAAARSAPAPARIAELAQIVSDRDDHVSAAELAGWLRAGRPRLRVLDLRSASEFNAYHIPGAEHVPLDRLATTPLASDETIVLYSQTGVHAGQAWVLLRLLGHHQVVFLAGGLHEWLDDVMHPTLPADAGPDTRAAFARTAELSRWFGGTPATLDAAPARRYRGC